MLVVYKQRIVTFTANAPVQSPVIPHKVINEGKLDYFTGASIRRWDIYIRSKQIPKSFGANAPPPPHPNRQLRKERFETESSIPE